MRRRRGGEPTFQRLGTGDAKNTRQLRLYTLGGRIITAVGRPWSDFRPVCRFTLGAGPQARRPPAAIDGSNLAVVFDV